MSYKTGCVFAQVCLRLYEMYVRNYLDGIHDIQDKTPCIALTPFKHENGRVD
jgi:hypothetical protein